MIRGEREATMTINETVYFWQDALFRLNLGKCHQSRLEYAARALKQVAHCHDMAPPQTLGELCMEHAQDGHRAWMVGGDPCHKNVRRWWKWRGLLEKDGMSITIGDIQALRGAMYRKNRGGNT